MTVAHNTGVKPGVMRVEIKITEIKIDLTMMKESTPSPEILKTEAGAS